MSDGYIDTEYTFTWEDQDVMCGMSGRFINATQSPVSSPDEPVGLTGSQTGKRARESPALKDDDAHSKVRGSKITDDKEEDEVRAQFKDTESRTCASESSCAFVDITHESTLCMELLTETIAAADADLCAAVKRGDVRGYKEAIARGADPSALTADGRPLLHLAAANERQDITRLMLQSSVDVDLTDNNNKLLCT